MRSGAASSIGERRSGKVAIHGIERDGRSRKVMERWDGWEVMAVIVDVTIWYLSLVISILALAGA